MDSSGARVDTPVELRLREQVALRRAALSDRVCWAVAGAGVVWLGLYAVLTALAQDSPRLAWFQGNVLYPVPMLVAVVLSAMAARVSQGRGRAMWRLLFAVGVCSLAGDLIWTGYGLVTAGGPPTPSIADAAYLLANVLTVPAIVIGFGAAHVLRRARGLLDAALIAVGLGAVGWPLLIAPQLPDSFDLDAVVVVAYPLLDVMILATLAAVGFAGHRLVPYPVLLMAASYLVMAVTDCVFTYVAVVHTYTDGSWLNVPWQARRVLIVLAALVAVRHRSEARVARFDRDLAFPAVLVAVLSVAALVGAEQVRNGRVGGGTLGVAAFVCGGLLVRQLFTTRDRTRLAHELQVSLQEQERLAVTDSLTGLYNRRFFQEMLKLESERAVRADEPMALIVVDLDRFKQINDTHGHPTGDAVLVQVADRIRQAVRNSDIVARYGGEEFVCLLPGAGEEAAAEVAERVRWCVRRTPIQTGPGHEIAVTASLGFAVTTSVTTDGAGTDGIDVERLVAAADRALYEAKAGGRDRVVSADRPLATPIEEDIALPAGLLWLADQVDAEHGTGQHSAVARWCLAVGDRLGLDMATLRATAAAGRLHDIGKITVDEAVLRKPGQPDADEWAQLRCHPQEGARLVANLGEHGDLASLIAAHHERYDGTGYPQGLAGEQIPIGARIIAICDAWAAMRTDRPYARALTTAEARAQIELGRGGQFDPTVADAFLALLDEGVIDDMPPARAVPRDDARAR
ncbi:bifunctional diguanylate cyclase/phosphohydrolase [Couchioplanes caeruleus]|uniref:Diguanylate cyclase (GGDEF)-like protein n=2 Tax=Couchioplanes caeruleus TaxID=56438 RepID=A0A1K0GPH7_9ACTN|nr:diguanylate cyclase [Couchioplanes caeruleus]OJF14278.1 hypothetical protein BG844_10630 [Couchioplanes caeruleus subsp. caeruleus]ROP31603.1 diguanylate cyclase (GGDEF)-like protein [Couchioplanes caeruleus]